MALVAFLNTLTISQDTAKAAFQKVTYPVPSVIEWLSREEVEERIKDLEGSYSLASGTVNLTKEQVAEYKKSLLRFDELERP